MNIEQAARNWKQLGENDPMWAILSAENKRGNKWSRDDFFATGREDVESILKTVQEAGLTINFGTALDFGCGLGRLSQALAFHFQHVYGVDVSESMIEQARQHNKFGDRVEYHLNVKTDLQLLPKKQFDFVCSLIVLQHIPPRHQLLYLAGFMDLLRPGGVAFFQTIHARGLRALFPNWFVELYRGAKHRGKPYIPMFGVKPSRVEQVIRDHGCILRKQLMSGLEGYESRYFFDTFVVLRNAANR
jgi:2-polyprenyl-3-methyl-5-hydroxy-6-metoxy-1,4-benzoquinol methylase